MKIKKEQCINCPFKEDGLKLGIEKMGEIQKYLIVGINHFCHSDTTNNTICRGGRNYQLEIWARMGVIEAPTGAALIKAMKEQGIEPREHI